MSIQGRRFDSAGTPVGGEFQVNSYIMGDQSNPAVAADADGDFVVVWNNDDSSGSASIQGQRFDSLGTPVGDKFQVNTYTTGTQTLPAVAADADGDSVVVWLSDASSGPDSDLSIQGQRFDSVGAPVGDEFQVNTYTTDRQRAPNVVFYDQGRFVVVWTSYGSSGSDLTSYSIQGQRFQSEILFRDGFESGNTSAW